MLPSATSTEDVLDQNAVNPNTGAALHREYGSTSSIDRQGLWEENFFLLCFEGIGWRTVSTRPGPFRVPREFFPCDPAISPAFTPQHRFPRGRFVRISGLDLCGRALLLGRDRDKPFKRRLKSGSPGGKHPSSTKLRAANMRRSIHLRAGRRASERGSALGTASAVFAHYDVQSILFNISKAIATRAGVGKRKNITTGASAASQTQMPTGHRVAATPRWG